MSFKEILHELVSRVPGGLGAIIVDWEGEAVDQSGALDDYSLKLMGAHKGIILDGLRRAGARADGNDLEEIVITTERLQTLILPVDREYFLLLTTTRESVCGRALFEARRTLKKIKIEIG